MDELRRQLDEKHGERRRWARLLVPLLPTGTATQGPPARAWLLPASALSLLIALPISLIWWSQRGGDIRSTAVARVPGAETAMPVARAGGPAGRTTGDPAAFATCLGELSALWSKQVKLDRLMARTSGPRSLYGVGRDNEVAARALRPLLEPVVRAADGTPVPFQLSCRDLACRLESLGPPERMNNLEAGPEITPALTARVGNWEAWPPETVRDAVSGEPLEKRIAFFGLRRQDGGAVPVTEGWMPIRNESAAPADLASCRVEVQTLQKDLALAALAREAHQDPQEALADSPPNPALAAELGPILRGVLARTVGATELDISCRGRACRLEVPAALAKQRPRWLAELHKDPALRPRLGGSTHAPGSAVGYLQVILPGFQKGPRWLTETLDRLIDAGRIEAAVNRCRPNRDTRGTVGVELFVTTGKLPHDTGERAPIRFAQVGSLAGTQPAECVTTFFRELLHDLEVPDNLWEGSIERQYEWK
jgi:hypothetical protein